MNQRASLSVEIWDKKTNASIFDKCICLLLLIPFFSPEGLIFITGFEWSYVWLAGLFVLFILAMPSLRFMSKACFLYVFFYLSIGLSTMLNGQDIMSWIRLAGKMIGFMILLNYYARIKKLRCLFQVLKAYLGALILITVCIQFLHQDLFGLTPAKNTVNFLTSDNFLGYYYIPFILTVYLADVGKSKRYRKMDLCFWGTICMASLIRAWAATCLAVFVAFIVLLFLFRKNKISCLLNPIIGLIANAGISVLVIGLQIQKYFDWLIVDILHKDLTLSLRTYIWGSAIANYLKKPILGYGTSSGGRLDINSFSIGLQHYTFFSHNVFLEVLIQGGIVAMVFFVLIYIGAHRSITRTKEHTELKAVIYISIFTLLLMQFSEFAIYMPIANLPLLLCFFYKDLQREGFEGETHNRKPTTVSLSRRGEHP